VVLLGVGIAVGVLEGTEETEEISGLEYHHSYLKSIL
jgi:hypothetical protein